MEIIFNINKKKLWLEDSMPTTEDQDDILVEFLSDHGYPPASFESGHQPQFYPALNVITFSVEINSDENLPDFHRFVTNGLGL
jgi:hypothetical protein